MTMTSPRSEWLLTTVNAVREVMAERLGRHELDARTEREMQMALELIEVIWEELVGQAGVASREHERFEEFFENAPDAFAVSDVGCNLREANRALAELLGVPRTELLGKPLTQYVAEDHRAEFLSRFIGLTLEPDGKSATWRSHLQAAGGQPVEVVVTVRAVPLRRTGVSGLCWAFRPR
jgi:PAS domain S-box-containing protein